SPLAGAARWTSDAAWAWLLDLFFYDLFWSSFLSAAPRKGLLAGGNCDAVNNEYGGNSGSKMITV
ncbi:hypothetical protein, partial [Pseudoflavonifractor sp. An184]|uniref:hypothetical protein n=1 Tax=Pseudoflavonifractor sp. An184 TaxID=1965576 RepID=UPI001950C842